MKQIYTFEQFRPPVLNENMLMKEMERRKTQLQTMLLTLAVILIQVVVIMLGIFTYNFYPLVSFICVLHVGITTLSSGAIAIVFTKKRRSLVCQ